jgi:hypothetical protein
MSDEVPPGIPGLARQANESDRQAKRRGPWRRAATIALRVGLLGVIAWLVWRELRGIDLLAAKEHVQAADTNAVMLALAAALCLAVGFVRLAG